MPSRSHATPLILITVFAVCRHGWGSSFQVHLYSTTHQPELDFSRSRERGDAFKRAEISNIFAFKLLFNDAV
ncbi:hypothetical protein C8R43DRAFT_985794, partial [Mycena crocata]